MSWKKFEAKTLFISCPGDLVGSIPVIRSVVERINRLLPLSERWHVSHWEQSDRSWDSRHTWQSQIERTSDPLCRAVICLFGERLGEPLPRDFPIPDDFEVPEWVSLPSQADPAKVPLTGTLFELLDAYPKPQNREDDRPVLIYVLGDERKIRAEYLEPIEREFGFGWEYKRLSLGSYRLPSAKEIEYDRQIKWLSEALFNLIQDRTRKNRGHQYFGLKTDESVLEAYRSLQSKLELILPSVLGAPHSGAVRDPKGLLHYDIEDSPIFFGRSNAIRRVFNRFESANNVSANTLPIIAITGRSGEGKSSFLRAGLAGWLDRQEPTSSGIFYPVVLDLKVISLENPLDYLAAAIGSRLGKPLWEELQPSDFLEAQQAVKLVAAVSRGLTFISSQVEPLARRLFIVLDHGEILLLNQNGRNAGNSLLPILAQLARAGSAWIGLTLTSDQVAQFKDTFPYFRFLTEELHNPSYDELREIVFSSRERLGLLVTVSQAEEISAQAYSMLTSATDTGPILPLLSSLLSEMNRVQREARMRRVIERHFRSGARPSRVLKSSGLYTDYLALPAPSLTGTLGRIADLCVAESDAAKLPDLHERLARLFRKLVQVSVGVSGSQKAIGFCSSADPVVHDLDRLIRALEVRRLLICGNDGSVRLAHLALLDHWHLARSWFEKDIEHERVLIRVLELARVRVSFDQSQNSQLGLFGKGELDEMEDLWVAYTSDTRLPASHLRAIFKSSLGSDRPSSWFRGDGRSRLSGLFATGDVDIISFSMTSLSAMTIQEKSEILKSSKESFNAILGAAVQACEASVIRQLLMWARAETTGDNNNIPLLLAASSGRLEVVEDLINAGFDPFSETEDRWKPIHLAAQGNHASVLSFFASAHPELVEACVKGGATLLHIAVANRSHLVVERIVRSHPELAATRDDKGNNALHVAAANGDVDLCRVLLELAPDLVASKGADDLLPLHLAAMNGNLDLVALLFDHAPRTALGLNKQKVIPAHLAALNGHVEIVRFFASRVPQVLSTTSTNGSTILHFAVLSGREDLIAYLISTDALLLKSADQRGIGPFEIAATYGHLQILDLILQFGEVDVAAKKRAFASAAKNGHEDIVVAILDSCPDVAVGIDVADLMCNVALYGFSRLFDTLRRRSGLNAYAATQDGLTPLHCAAMGGHGELCSSLLDSDPASASCKTLVGRTPLHMAALGGQPSICRLLLELYNCDPNPQTNDCKTPLHLAAWRGHFEVVKLLVRHNGTDLFARTLDGENALSLARRGGHEQVADFLMQEVQELS